MSDNSEQRQYWNDRAGDTWASFQMQLDRATGPFGDAALKRLAPRPGERILDIGCGCGQTTLELGARVGASGLVLGIDLSRQMLAVARARPEAAVSHCRFVEGDAAADDLAALAGGQRYDAAYSRFGVMFFADPVPAFANIRRALKDGGRMTFVCWRPMAENPWMHLPIDAVRGLLPPLAASDPLAPGPFAFADPARVADLLGRAGWSSLHHCAFDHRVDCGTVPEAAELLCRVGPLGAALRENRHLLPAVHTALHRRLEQEATQGRVQLPGAVWIWEARAG